MAEEPIERKSGRVRGKPFLVRSFVAGRLRHHSVFTAVLALTILVAGCGRAPQLQDGAYTAFSAHAEEDGWTPGAEIVVSDSEISEAYFDYIGASGELLRHEAYARSDWEDSFGEDPAETLEAFASQVVSSGGIDGITESDIPSLQERFTLLIEKLLDRAREGKTDPVLVDTEAGGGSSDLEALIAAFDPDNRESRRRMVRGGTADPGAFRGGYAAVSSHHLAVSEAMNVLESGGTAADAAVVLGTMMSVVEPFLSHALGGGSWILYYDADSQSVYSVDAVGPTPMAATAELFRKEEFHGTNGVHRSIVPGAWGGYMELLKEFGSRPLDELLAPAIESAYSGVPVSSAYANWFPLRADFVATLEDSAAIFTRDGRPLEVGSTLVNEDLGRTYEGISDAYSASRTEGERTALDRAADYYYRGPIAEEIVRFSDENGGLFALSDFNDFYDYGIVDPISIEYRGLDVYQNPPNSQGIAMLGALNILEGFDFSELEPNDPEAVHLMSEALKLSFADRNRYVADPAFYDVPVAELLSEEHAAAQRELISMDSSLEYPIDDVLGMRAADPRNTSTFHATDRYGNMVAITSSVGLSFMVAGDTGITLNERLTFMSTDPDDVNRIEPGKKVRHSAGPYLVVRDGQPYIAGGNTGADFQPQGQLQQFINIFEFNLDPQDAVDLPRFQPQAFAATNYPFAAPTRLALEQDSYSQETWDNLAARGHNVEWAGYFGRQNVIVVEDFEDGEIMTGAESREEDSHGMSAGP